MVLNFRHALSGRTTELHVWCLVWSQAVAMLEGTTRGAVVTIALLLTSPYKGALFVVSDQPWRLEIDSLPLFNSLGSRLRHAH